MEIGVLNKKTLNKKEMLKRKKAWLDKLYYSIGNQGVDFFLTGTYKKNGENEFTKWKKYSECIFPLNYDGTCDDWKTYKFFESINQRQIFPNEIVLDLEEKEQLKPIVEKLNKMESIKEFKIFSTGSRGYHVHILFNEEIDENKKLFFIKIFKTDEQKASLKTMIALEGNPHWKTGNLKKEIEL